MPGFSGDGHGFPLGNSLMYALEALVEACRAGEQQLSRNLSAHSVEAGSHRITEENRLTILRSINSMTHGTPSGDDCEQCAEIAHLLYIALTGNNIVPGHVNFLFTFGKHFFEATGLSIISPERAAFFAGGFDGKDGRFVRAAHVAEAFVTTTAGSVRDADEPHFRTLGMQIGFEVLETIQPGLAQTLWRLLSSNLAATCSSDVYIFCPHGMPFDSILWMNELPVLSSRLKEGRIENLYYNTTPSFPNHVIVRRSGTSLEDDGEYTVREGWDHASSLLGWRMESVSVGSERCIPRDLRFTRLENEVLYQSENTIWDSGFLPGSQIVPDRLKWVAVK